MFGSGIWAGHSRQAGLCFRMSTAWAARAQAVEGRSSARSLESGGFLTHRSGAFVGLAWSLSASGSDWSAQPRVAFQPYDLRVGFQPSAKHSGLLESVLMCEEEATRLFLTLSQTSKSATCILLEWALCWLSWYWRIYICIHTGLPFSSIRTLIG